MTWGRIDDRFFSHVKVRKLVSLPGGREAIGLWTLAQSWCNSELTDGHVPAFVIHQLGGWKKKSAELLVAVGLWVNDEGGYKFNGWSERNQTKQQVIDKREKTAKKVREWRESQGLPTEKKESGNQVTDGLPTDPKLAGNPAPVPVPVPVPIQKEEEETPKASSVAPAEPTGPSDAVRILELESRYPAGIASEARKACAMSRRSGKMVDSLWLAQLEAMSKHPADTVARSMRTFVDRYADGEKDERYLLGIVRGEAKAPSGRPGSANGNNGRPQRARATGAADFENEPDLAEQMKGWANG